MTTYFTGVVARLRGHAKAVDLRLQHLEGVLAGNLVSLREVEQSCLKIRRAGMAFELALRELEAPLLLCQLRRLENTTRAEVCVHAELSESQGAGQAATPPA